MNAPTIAVGALTYLRPLEEADLEVVLKWDKDPEVHAWAGKKFESPEECRDWLRTRRRSPNSVAFAIVTHDGRLIGDLELEQIDWKRRTAELRISIGDKTQWGKGLGSDAVLTALKVAAFQLRLKSVYLRVAVENHRAIRCYTKCGFRKRKMLRFRNGREGAQDILLMEVTFPQSAC
ncbi:MAG: GNAT family N-acetyltransferase [Bacillota bacterium]